MSQNVWVKSGTVRNMYLEPGTTGTTTSLICYKDAPKTTFQAIVNGIGAVGATVVIDASNDGVNWTSTVMGTITLSGTTVTSDGFTSDAPWKFVRARTTAISGTGALVQVYMGV